MFRAYAALAAMWIGTGCASHPASPDSAPPPALDAPAIAPARDAEPAAVVPCPGVEFPDQVSSEYVLPYPIGDRHNVRQGNCNRLNTHNERYNETFAYDFEMPIGSSVVAARGGTVIAVIEQFADDQHELTQANLVAIVHDDGSYAKYGHITRDGALVDTGDRVDRGQPIALSGNTGLSRGPHLHFSVKRCPPGDPIGSDTCVTIPIAFRNTRPHPYGLIGSPTSEIGGGEWYEALPDPPALSR